MISHASSPAAASQTLASHRRLFLPGTHYPLLLAIDNDDNAAAAVRVTAALARLGAHPMVVKALQLMAPATGGDAADTTFLFVQSALGEEIIQNDKRIIGDIIRSVLGGDPTWPINVIVGEPSSAILREAEEREAELLVLGLSRHGAFARALGENTATRVMSKAAMPTLAVRPDADSLPRLAMVATDFGNASWEAAHIAANLVNPGGTVILTHVALPSYPAVDDGDEGQTLIHRLGVDGAFQRLATEIKTDKSIDVKFVKREGDAGTELLAAAEQINPDVIATASQRHHLLARMLLGSVSRKLVREGKWSMLVTPPPNTH